MRSLALLLILANIVLFAWQKSMLPWFPWQPDSFAKQKSYFPNSDLPQLVLLREQADTTAELEITQAPTETPETVLAKVEIPIAEKSEAKLEEAQHSNNTESVKSKPVENKDNIVAKIESPITVTKEPIFEAEENAKELIDQEFETAESIFEEIESAALNKNDVAESDNTKSKLEIASKDSDSQTENTEKGFDSQTVVIPEEILSAKEIIDNQSTKKADDGNKFFKAFANFYNHLISTTVSLLNVPIDQSDTGNVIVKVGTNDAHIRATALTDKMPDSVKNTETEKEKIAESEKIKDIQKDSENKTSDNSKLAEKPKSSISKDSVDTQPSDSSDDSKTMTTLAKATVVSIETSQKVEEKTEKNTKAEAENQDEKSSTQSQALCFQTGHYSRSDSAKTVMNWFTKQKVNVKIHQRKMPILESTWVYLPPFHNRRTALRTQRLLTQYGIKDHALATWKKQPNAVSLGLFRDPMNAELRVKELKEKGFFNVQSEKRYKNDTRYWLSVKIPHSQSVLIESFRKKFKARDLKSVSCD